MQVRDSAVNIHERRQPRCTLCVHDIGHDVRRRQQGAAEALGGAYAVLRGAYLELCGAALREAASWQATEAALTALRCARRPARLSAQTSWGEARERRAPVARLRRRAHRVACGAASGVCCADSAAGWCSVLSHKPAAERVEAR